MISPDLCPEKLRVPVPRAFRNSRGRRHWAMGVPRFIVDANSPAGLAARAAALLREQRGACPHGLPAPPADANEDPRRSTAAAAAAAGPAAGAVTGAAAAAAAAAAAVAVVAVEAVPRSRSRGRHNGSSSSNSSNSSSSSSSNSSSGSRGPGEVSFGVSIARTPPLPPEESWPRRGDGGPGSDGGREGEDEKDVGLEGWTTGRRGSVDPTLFSFWLAANLPLDDDARQELLMLDSVIMRLR